MTISIRKATKDDIPTVYKMMNNLAIYMNAKNGPAITLEDLYRDGGFDGDNAYFFILLAEDEGIKNSDGSPAAVGYTMCSFLYSWDGKTIFMRNMLVEDSHRSKGVGRLIFEALLKYGKENRCTRIEFLVPEWNPAQQFYEKMGAVNYTTRTGYQYYRVNEEIINSVGQDHF